MVGFSRRTNGSAIGSGIGSLAAGKSVEDALTNAAIGGAIGYGAGKLGFAGGGGGGIGNLIPSFKGRTMMGMGSPISKQALAKQFKGKWLMQLRQKMGQLKAAAFSLCLTA